MYEIYSNLVDIFLVGRRTKNSLKKKYVTACNRRDPIIRLK